MPVQFFCVYIYPDGLWWISSICFIQFGKILIIIHSNVFLISLSRVPNILRFFKIYFPPVTEMLVFFKSNHHPHLCTSFLIYYIAMCLSFLSFHSAVFSSNSFSWLYYIPWHESRTLLLKCFSSRTTKVVYSLTSLVEGICIVSCCLLFAVTL